MFNNLVNPANTVAVNIQNQIAIYAAPGEAVIQVFADETEGMTLTEINQHSNAIRAAMEAEIVRRVPPLSRCIAPIRLLSASSMS